MSAGKITTSAAAFLAVGMLITGSINTLSTKWANITESVGRDGTKGDYEHPFVQALGMFVGETLCLIAFFALNFHLKRTGQADKIEVANPHPFWIFSLPALCDMIGTSLMYVGLNYTAASSFQMLRGAVVIFTGIFSVIFLGRKLRPYHWLGMLLVLGGLLCVGLSNTGGDDDSKNPALGNTLVIIAQLVVATQMVVEEKLLTKYNVPALQAVGSEGIWGMVGMLLLLILFQNIPGLPGTADPDHFEDSLDALHRLGDNPIILVATLGNIFSISFFNFFGLSVTKRLSATTRMVLDSVRTLVVWGAGLALGWERFQYMKIVGFVLLLLGTCVYNKIVRVPNVMLDHQYWSAIEEEEEAALAQKESEEQIINGDKSHAINLGQPLLVGGQDSE